MRIEKVVLSTILVILLLSLSQKSHAAGAQMNEFRNMPADEKRLVTSHSSIETVEDYLWAANFGSDALDNNGLPGRALGTDDPYNGFGVPNWTGNFTLSSPIGVVTQINATVFPFTGDQYTYTLTEGVDFLVYAGDNLIELLTPLDVDIINEHWKDGVNNTLNGWPWINYVASGISKVYVNMNNGTARYGRNLGYAAPPPSEWWYDPDWPWELEGWWAFGCYFPAPWCWPAGSDWWVNYTAASYLTVEYIVDIHDVAVNRAITLRTGCPPIETMGQGYVLQMNITVENQGNFAETFNTMIYANGTQIGQLTSSLNPGENETLMLSWNTTSFAKGNYFIVIVADIVPNETDQSDNTLNYGWILLTLPGDVDGNHRVNIFDITRMANSYQMPDTNPAYDPNCDIDGDGVVNIFDVVIAADNYGESW